MTEPDSFVSSLRMVAVWREELMPELHCYTDDTDTVVAASIEDARAAWKAHLGDDREHDDTDYPFELVPDEQKLRIDNAFDDGKMVEKAAGDWAASNGRGFLCSTEY